MAYIIKITRETKTILLSISCLFVCLACSTTGDNRVDELNAISYDYHYRNLDSTLIYAQRALNIAKDDADGQAEAYNNLAFVSIARMNYNEAMRQLDMVKKVSSNQIELLIADIQYMHLCQRQSRNKDFYDNRERAKRRLRRINEEKNSLTERQRKRMAYAQSEYDIVSSVYYYYVGQRAQSISALENVKRGNIVEQDTAQLLNYWYSIGADGVVTKDNKDEINQTEFDYLMQCYHVARRYGYAYWEAQALQGLSEHLQSYRAREVLVRNNLPRIKSLNTDNMPDSLLAGNLAQRSLDLFRRYGDVYQTAGAYRTLGTCYWEIGDYKSALICLQTALNADTLVNRAPSMVASIREGLCLVYSAMNQKQLSDYNRNEYLDIQEQTRQDRTLEARAEQLNKSSRQLNTMIVGVVVMIVIVMVLMYVFDVMRRKNERKTSIDKFLIPLGKWEIANKKSIEIANERCEEIQEKIEMVRLHIQENKKLNVEQRAKVSLVNSITPFIERMLNEINNLIIKAEGEAVRAERYEYIVELTEKINEYNNVLTQWIQMQQGELSLNIESFELQQVLDIVEKAKTTFRLNGINLVVKPCSDVVKADKALTMFMINTMADNARKFTNAGGQVTISATSSDDYLEISIEDTGCGLDDNEREHIFEQQVIKDSHGFGLMNCKGIIDKYRKTSKIFSVCDIGVDSEKGKGSRFFFRLPKGVMRRFIILIVFCFGLCAHINSKGESKEDSVSSAMLSKAGHFADSMYNSNVDGTYYKTISFADSCCKYLNKHYHILRPEGKDIMLLYGNASGRVAELDWFNNKLSTNYNIILNMRNEVAVAALALHEWDLYRYNNGVYADLFRKSSADNTLNNYVQVMQHSGVNKTVGVILLILLLILLFPAYYFIYYRYRLRYRFSVDRLRVINDVLLSSDSAETKLAKINKVWNNKKVGVNSKLQKLELVVNKIEDTLKESIEYDNNQNMSITMAEEKLYQMELENDNLHICNSILDNCLSALKHETMYYPYRISQMVVGNNSDEQSIFELISYYKELFSMLSAQAMKQLDTVKLKCKTVNISGIDTPLLGDEDMLEYLFDMLKKPREIDVRPKDDKYVVINIAMPDVHLTAEQCNMLFQPPTIDVRYLICRQIVRDIGECTNARGCGISATYNSKGEVVVEVTLARTSKNK